MNYLWYKNTIIYSLNTETYFDSNGSGTGDFKGLIERLDYIASLGVGCIWLLPFYPNGGRDDGYDVKSYYDVDHKKGTLGDFVTFMDKADALGIRVIIDLVVNHTSIEHPWFKRAREDRNSPYRDYYVWSDQPQEFDQQSMMFRGEENSIWTYDEAAGQYYLHVFYKEQPDLNIANPIVREEILKIMNFWLRLGVAGFRVDAAEHIIDPYGTDARKEDLAGFLNEMRSYVAFHKPDAILLAETNIEPDIFPTYFDGNSKMHMGFNFYLNQHLFLAMAKKDAGPLHEALRNMPDSTPSVQMVNFLRHHDELSLKLLTPEEKKIVFDAYAPEPEARIFEDQGIRRRLAPMLGGKRELIELAYSLMFSMPGTPMIRYGDEIGMGDDLSLEGRDSVRTPMQWSEAKNGGFSTCVDELGTVPMIADGPYGYPNLNVARSQRDSNSFLNWMERLISVRQRHPHIGRGKVQTFPLDHSGIFVHTCDCDEDRIVFVHNLSGKAGVVRRHDIGMDNVRLIPQFYSASDPENETDDIEISAYGYKWLWVDNGK